MKEKIQDDQIKKIYLQAQDFCMQAKKLASKEQLAGVEIGERKKMGAVLQNAVEEAKRLLELLHFICPYCRQAGGQIIGECIQCGQEVCSSCAVEIEGQLVHRDICARFFRG